MSTIKKIDPIYHLLRFIFKDFLKANLNDIEKDVLFKNIDKYRFALWVTVIASIFVTQGLTTVSRENIDTLILSLFAPVTVMGTAWFAISFGGIPAKLLNTALSITAWMLSSFLVSLSTMFIAVAFISPAVMWPVFVLIYIGAVMGLLQYDAADGLKVGLDDTVMKHSRTALRYYREKEGIIDEDRER